MIHEQQRGRSVCVSKPTDFDYCYSLISLVTTCKCLSTEFANTAVCLNLNLNSLLVKRQNDSPSPGDVTRGN